MPYTYTLRYMLDPNTNTNEKNIKLLQFVKKAKIDDVAFFINGEELNQSHLTQQQTKTWLNAIIPLQKELNKMGVTTSLNPWTTIMHSDRGFTVNPKIGFDTFVDFKGHKAKDMACPADPKWKSYIVARYKQYASIHPNKLWLEDDFRHYNHTPLKLMCFCDRHMKIYQKALGKKISRENFVANMLKPGKPTVERKIYLNQARQEMIEIAHLIEKGVHEISPQTELGLMTSFPNWHAIEARDWKGLFNALSGKNRPFIARPHLPSYNEVSPLQYGRNFEKYTRITAAYLGSNARLYPELENCMYSPLVKSLSFTRFQIISTALIGAHGILLNLFDMMGNGINNQWHYAQMLSEIKPFVSKLFANRLRMNHLRGIKILVDQDSAYTIHAKKGGDPEEWLPHEQNWASLLSCFGFATTIQPVSKEEINFAHQIIAISGQLLRNLDNNQIQELLEKNTVLLDGESVQVLIDRKLSNLLHIKEAKWYPNKTAYQSFEQADGITVDDVKNPRITMLQHTGYYLKLKYEQNSNVKIWTYAYNSADKRLGNVMAVIDGHIIVMPMNQDPEHGWESQYTTYKQKIYQQIFENIKPLDYLIEMPNVKLNISDNGRIWWLSNFSFDSYSTVKIHLSKKLQTSKVRIIRYCKDGFSIEETKAKLINGFYIIRNKLSALETIQILVE